MARFVARTGTNFPAQRLNVFHRVLSACPTWLLRGIPIVPRMAHFMVKDLLKASAVYLHGPPTLFTVQRPFGACCLLSTAFEVTRLWLFWEYCDLFFFVCHAYQESLDSPYQSFHCFQALSCRHSRAVGHVFGQKQGWWFVFWCLCMQKHKGQRKGKEKNARIAYVFKWDTACLVAEVV